MFNWAEDNIIRERVFVPADKQADYELYPGDPAGRAGRRQRPGQLTRQRLRSALGPPARAAVAETAIQPVAGHAIRP